MVLRAIGPRTGKRTVQHAQLTDLRDFKLFPSMRRTALTLAADLKTEQGLDATMDSVVVRLDDTGASGFVDELDETLVNNRAHEIVIHASSPSVVPANLRPCRDGSQTDDYDYDSVRVPIVFIGRNQRSG
jgi:hypothetical protein